MVFFLQSQILAENKQEYVHYMECSARVGFSAKESGVQNETSLSWPYCLLDLEGEKQWSF